jgi:hypothetical protein
MENYGEASVIEFARIMRDYLEGRTDVHAYRQNLFGSMTKRTNLNEEESRIVQQAYGDADDYDQAVSLTYTLDEPELKTRIAKSLKDLGVAESD